MPDSPFACCSLFVALVVTWLEVVIGVFELQSSRQRIRAAQTAVF